MVHAKQAAKWSGILGVAFALLNLSVASAEGDTFQTNADFFKEFEAYEKKLPPVDERSDEQKVEARALHAENRRREIFESRDGGVTEEMRTAFEKGRPSFKWVKEHASEYLATLHQEEESGEPEDSETKRAGGAEAVAATQKSRKSKPKVCESDCANPLEYLKGHPLDPNELIAKKAESKANSRKARSARTSVRRVKPVPRQDGAGVSEDDHSKGSLATPSGVSSTR